MRVKIDEIQPPDAESTILARASAEELSRLLHARPEAARAHVKLGDADLVLPRQAIALLRDILTEMAQGNAVTIIPTHAELTTQEAADILNVSRPHLIKVLEEGKIPFTKVGAHRRVLLKNLMAYKQRRAKETESSLQALVDEAQKLDLGY